MHNNYYFLRQVSKALKSKIIDYELLSCFSQNKNELILELSYRSSLFYIRLNTSSELTAISFPSEFARSKKNSVDLFSEIKYRKITSIIQFENDRSFGICFGEYTLVFLFHGVRSNIVLFKEEEPIVFFNKKLSRGFKSKLSEINFPINLSFEEFEKFGFNLKKLVPTLDKVAFLYLEELKYSTLDHKEQWVEVQNLLNELEKPTFYTTLINKKPELSLLKVGEIKESFSDPLEAANAFFQFFHFTYFFQNTKEKLLKEYEESIKRTESYITKTDKKLQELTNSNQYEQFANILMANLNVVETGVKSATLYDFYHSREINIPLKETLSPQKNAELYYKKAKNKKLEINNLEEALCNKNEKLSQLKKEHVELMNINNSKSLKVFSKTVEVTKFNEPVEEAKPFKRVEFEGYEILIGKNAKSNDELLQKHTYKEDLWLHAKDVTGSHVILKYKSGNNFPSHVIERAAEIAAFNSRRKTDSHCPVIYTPRKFVRKQKGMAPGAVAIDKEKVIMVSPRGY